MDTLVIGILQAPYGLRGELKVRSLSGEADHFFRLEGSALTLRPVVAGVPSDRLLSHVVESVRESAPHLLIKFKNFDTPEKARALTGSEILVDRAKAAPLDENEYYIGDLVGCQLVYQGESLGTVRSVWETGAHEMLEVKLDDEQSEKGWRLAQVPFRSPFIGTVDTAGRRIELLVDWILE